jgi:inorganic pyrophosphatase
MQKNVDSYIGQVVEVVMDRPLGSKHPKHGFRYEVNYGYIPNTVSGDGEELDAYFLGTSEAVERISGKCIAIIHRTNDNDDKLVVIPETMDDLSDKEIRQQTHFQEQFFDSIIIRK